MNTGCVVLNYNDFAETAGCVDNLLNIDRDNVLRIVIVDNCSDNDSYRILKDRYENNSNVFVLRCNTNGGYARGNNRGLKYIYENFPKVRYTLIMNPDTRIEKFEYILKLEGALNSDPELAVVAPVAIYNGDTDYMGSAWNVPNGRQLLQNHSKILRYKTRQYIDESSRGVVYADAVQGAFFMCRMNALSQTGFFDERTFMYSEEVLLAMDLRKAGYKEAVVTDCFFIHNHKTPYTAKPLKRRMYLEKNYFKSRKVYCRKYLNRLTLAGLYITHWLNIIYIILSNPLVKIRDVNRGKNR